MHSQLHHTESAKRTLSQGLPSPSCQDPFYPSDRTDLETQVPSFNQYLMSPERIFNNDRHQQALTQQNLPLQDESFAMLAPQLFSNLSAQIQQLQQIQCPSSNVETKLMQLLHSNRRLISANIQRQHQQVPYNQVPYHNTTSQPATVSTGGSSAVEEMQKLLLKVMRRIIANPDLLQKEVDTDQKKQSCSFSQQHNQCFPQQDGVPPRMEALPLFAGAPFLPDDYNNTSISHQYQSVPHQDKSSEDEDVSGELLTTMVQLLRQISAHPNVQQKQRVPNNQHFAPELSRDMSQIAHIQLPTAAAAAATTDNVMQGPPLLGVGASLPMDHQDDTRQRDYEQNVLLGILSGQKGNVQQPMKATSDDPAILVQQCDNVRGHVTGPSREEVLTKQFSTSQQEQQQPSGTTTQQTQSLPKSHGHRKLDDAYQRYKAYYNEVPLKKAQTEHTSLLKSGDTLEDCELLSKKSAKRLKHKASRHHKPHQLEQQTSNQGVEPDHQGSLDSLRSLKRQLKAAKRKLGMKKMKSSSSGKERQKESRKLSRKRPAKTELIDLCDDSEDEDKEKKNDTDVANKTKSSNNDRNHVKNDVDTDDSVIVLEQACNDGATSYLQHKGRANSGKHSPGESHNCKSGTNWSENLGTMDGSIDYKDCNPNMASVDSLSDFSLFAFHEGTGEHKSGSTNDNMLCAERCNDIAHEEWVENLPLSDYWDKI